MKYPLLSLDNFLLMDQYIYLEYYKLYPDLPNSNHEILYFSSQ